MFWLSSVSCLSGLHSPSPVLWAVSQSVETAARKARSPVPSHVLPLNPEMVTGARAFVADLVRQDAQVVLTQDGLR